MGDLTLPLDVDGPVTAEVFTLCRSGDALELTGPCGAAPWLIEVGREEHPLETVRRIVEGSLPDLELLHSTSWRWDRQSVVLTFVAVVPDPSSMEHRPVDRAELARSSSTSAPDDIEHGQVLEHAIRHVAWLAAEDDVVRSTLDRGWHGILSAYVPEPFRQLGV